MKFHPSFRSDTMDGLWKEFSVPIKSELDDVAVVPVSTGKKAKTRGHKDDIKKPKKKIDKFDMFEEWIEGDVTLRYNPKDHDAKKHLSGWAMRNTNNHNKKVLKKSCLGVFVCNKGQCRGQSGEIVSVRPATSDRARRKQSEKSCPRPGCGGKLTHVPCTGKGGYPVTHFWRVTDSVIVFQSKGIHDHPRPDVVKTTSMAKIALLEYHRRNRHERPKEICKKVGVQIHKSFSRVDRVARQLREVQGIVGDDHDMKKSLIPGDENSYNVQTSWDQRIKNEHCLSDAFQSPASIHSYNNYYPHHQLMSDGWYVPTHAQDAYRFPSYGVPHVMNTGSIADDTYHHSYVDAGDSCSYDPFRDDAGFESHPSATIPISQASANGYSSRAAAEFGYSPIKHQVATLPDTLLNTSHDITSLMVSPKEQEVPNTEASLHTFNSSTVSRASVDPQSVPELTPIVSNSSTGVMLSSGADIISAAFQQAAELPMTSSPSDGSCLATSTTMANMCMSHKKRGPPELLPIEPKRRKISNEQPTDKPATTPVSINLDLPSFSDIFDISAAFGDEGLAGRPKSPVYHSPSPTGPASSPCSSVISTDNSVLPSTSSDTVTTSATGSHNREDTIVTTSAGPSHSYDIAQHSSTSIKSLTQLNTHHPIRDEENGTYIDLLVSMYLGEKEPDKLINKNEFHVYTERHNSHLRSGEHGHYGSYDSFKSQLSNTQFDFSWYESERKAQRYRLSNSGLDNLISPLGLGGHSSSYESYSSPYTSTYASDLHSDSNRHTSSGYSRHLY